MPGTRRIIDKIGWGVVQIIILVQHGYAFEAAVKIVTTDTSEKVGLFLFL